MRESVTTLLDTLGLLTFAAGVTGGAWPYLGPASLCAGGLVVLGGSWLAARGDRS